ncbi:MAG: hypothetical protein RLO50_11450 [Azospirillaceae bacterium]
MSWTIETITVATARTPGSEVTFQRGFGEWVDIAIHCFLLRDGRHRVLVDTGLLDEIEPLNRAMRRRKGHQAGFVRQENALGEMLTSPLDAVVLTSFGPYAVGGIARLHPATRLVASARGLADLRRPEEPMLVHALPPALGALLQDRSEPVTGAVDLLPGLTVMEVGVHHPASMAVRLDTDDGPLVIADPVFTRANVIDGVALGAAEHAAGWYEMVRRLAAGGARFLPIHDPSPEPVSPGAWLSGVCSSGAENEASPKEAMHAR